MTWIILILMCGLPFSSIFLHIQNIWVSHGAFFQVMILIAFSYSLFKVSPKPIHQKVSNKPLACLFLWLGLITALYWNLHIIQHNQYNFILFMPFFNFLSLVLFYKVIVQYLNSRDIDKILRYFSYVIGIIAIYCILQRLNLDQFHKHFSVPSLPDQVVGTIGNPTHLGAWLAICLPILYYTKIKFSTFTILLVWSVILLTGSASALIVAIILTIFYNFHYQIRFKHEKFLFGSLAVLGLVIVYLKGFDWITNSFLNPQGRFEYWKGIYPVFKESPIIGSGLGRILSFNQHWKHVHNEYYQLAIEGGVIGLGIAIWGIIEYFKRFIRLERTKLSVCLATMFIGFLLLSMVNFTCHLWQIGILAMFSYASLFCLGREI